MPVKVQAHHSIDGMFERRRKPSRSLPNGLLRSVYLRFLVKVHGVVGIRTLLFRRSIVMTKDVLLLAFDATVGVLIAIFADHERTAIDMLCGLAAAATGGVYRVRTAPGAKSGSLPWPPSFGLTVVRMPPFQLLIRNRLAFGRLRRRLAMLFLRLLELWALCRLVTVVQTLLRAFVTTIVSCALANRARMRIQTILLRNMLVLSVRLF